VHSIHKRHTEDDGKYVHGNSAAILDVSIACKQEAVVGGLLPHVEGGVADAKLHAVTHMLDRHDVFSSGENEVCIECEQ